MSTGCSWEGIRQVRATLLDVRHVPERLCGGRVYLGRYIKCSTLPYRPQLDGDVRERQHVNPFTDNSCRHSVQQRHTRGRQRVSSPVRQLRLTLGLTVQQPH